MKGACESAPVGVMLGNVALLLHFCGMEDFIAKLKQFSKLDFQFKGEIINNGRPMLELNGLLQTMEQKITHIALNIFGTSKIDLAFRRTAETTC